MQDHLNKFIDTMSAAGCAPANSSDITDGVDNKLIKAADDRGAAKTLYVTFRTEGDGRAFGKWYSCKHSNGDTWFSKSSKEWTEEEKRAWQERRDAERAARRKEQEEGYERTAEAAQELWRGAKKVVEHPYLKKKGISGAGCRIHGGDLLIPLRDMDGKLWLLQTITAEGDKFNSFRLPDGKWASGGKKQGCYHGVVNGKTDKSVVVVCEGFATGRSIAEATGLAVVVALDAGNLKPVAEAMRKKFPDADIIIGADDDKWTPKTPRHKDIPEDYKTIPGDDDRWAGWRDADLLANAGKEKGGQAASAVDGYIVTPDIPQDDHDKRTDFNDLHLSEGAEAVSLLFQKVVEKAKENRQRKPEPPPSTELVPVEAYDEPARVPDGDGEVGDLGLPLRILGQNDGKYYYFPFGKQQIVALSASGHTINNLLQLCDLDTWKERLGANVQDNKIAVLAANMLMQSAHAKGVFQEDGSVRGCGAWVDAGRIIVHCGDKVYVDGVAQKPKDVYGRYVYVSSINVMNVGHDPLPDNEAIKLKEICSMPTWEMPLSGVLLAGWIVIAPICGALDWRPHIWIVGESASGKSTIITKIIRPVLDSVAINVDGLTTEPALRQMMGYSARPVVFDEANTKVNKSAGSSMDNIIMLSRMASSGGVIGKYGQNIASFRSCFCFGAVNPPITSLQDETRQTMMAVKKNTSARAEADYEALLAAIHETLTPEYSRRLLARTIDNLPTLLKNIKIFQSAAREVIKDPRAADQVSAMLGGFWLLHTTSDVTREQAVQMVSEYSWEEHTTIAMKSDPERLLAYISTSIIKAHVVQKDVTIGTLIESALGIDESIILKGTASEMLKNYSIKIADNGEVYFGANNPNLSKLLRDTEWATGYKKMLLKLDGARQEGVTYFSAGDRQRAVVLPKSYFEFEKDRDEALPLQDEDMEIPF